MTTNRRICRVRERKTIQDLIVIKVHAIVCDQINLSKLGCFVLSWFECNKKVSHNIMIIIKQAKVDVVASTLHIVSSSTNSPVIIVRDPLSTHSLAYVHSRLANLFMEIKRRVGRIGMKW